MVRHLCAHLELTYSQAGDRERQAGDRERQAGAAFLCLFLSIVHMYLEYRETNNKTKNEEAACGQSIRPGPYLIFYVCLASESEPTTHVRRAGVVVPHDY